MKRILLSLGLGLLTSIAFAGINNNDQPENNLVFSHDNYKLENFSFISKKFSVGLVNTVFQKSTLVILYNEENLIVDSINTDWKIEKILPSNDSSFFLMSDNQTLNCIIRNDEMLINGIYAGNNSTKGYDKLAFYSLPFPNGEFQVIQKSESKKEFGLQIFNENSQSFIYPFDQRKKHLNIDLFASQKSIYVYLPDRQKLIQMNKDKFDFDEIELDKNTGKWLFYHDYITDRSYLLNESKSIQKLYSLNDESELIFIKDLDFIPEAIFNSSLHKKSDKGRNYSHYLIPLDSKDKEKTIHLEGVTISSD